MSHRLDGAMVFAPTLLKFEMASIARKKMRQQPGDATKILTALNIVLEGRSGLDKPRLSAEFLQQRQPQQ